MNFNDVPATDYETDFALWIERQLQALGQRQFDQVDIDNLLEELGGILRSEKRQLESRLEVIVLHLLKCQCQPRRMRASWHKTLRTQRKRVGKLLRDSPSLQRLVPTFAEQCFDDAIRDAVEETGLPRSSFPPELPYTSAQILDPDFIP